MKNKNLVSVMQYARLCGFDSPHPIYMRKKRGDISFITDTYRGHPIYLVDIAMYPPIMRRSPGRKSYAA